MVVKRKLYLKLDKLKLQLFISLLQRDALSAKKFLSILCAQQIFKLDESLLFQLFQCKKARWTNSMASKTQTQKKKEDSLLLILPQESEEADSVISIVNYSGNCRNQRFDRPSFPVCKENRWAAISPSLPNYSRRGREGRKGEKRGACRFNPFELRSKTSPQPSSSSVFIQLCGPASICLRSSYEISTGRAYTHKRFYPV